MPSVAPAVAPIAPIAPAVAPIAPKVLSKSVIKTEPVRVDVANGTMIKGDGKTNVLTVVYSTTITIDELKGLLPGHLEGLECGIIGGSTFTIKPEEAINKSTTNNMLYTNQGSAWLMEKTIEMAAEQATILNPQVAMLAKMAQLEAKAKAYDVMMAKVAADDAKRKADYAERNRKMLETKAKNKAKSETASLASSGGKVEPVADAPVIEAVAKKPVKTVKTKAPSLAAQWSEATKGE